MKSAVLKGLGNKDKKQKHTWIVTFQSQWIQQ